MNFINLSTYQVTQNVPLLILVDLQKEYISEARPLSLATAEPAVENCRRLLCCARRLHFPVAFARLSQSSMMFNSNEPFSDWIEGSAPNGSDMIYQRSKPSCYANTQFARMMDDWGGANAVIAGLTGTVSCLATVIEGAQLQHRFTFIHDASASHVIRGHSESNSHDMATNVISLYARITSTDAWIEDQNQIHSTEHRELSGEFG